MRREKGTYRAPDVAEVPDLLQDGAVVAAPQVGHRARLQLERALQLAERVGRPVRRNDADAANIEIVSDASPSLVELEGDGTYAASMSYVGYCWNARMAAWKKSTTSWCFLYFGP